MYTHITVKILTPAGQSSPYTYLNHDDQVREGDYVVVMLPRGDPAVAVVVDGNPVEAARARATKYIVQRIDLDKYNALTALNPPPEPEDVYWSAAAKALKKYRANKQGIR